MKSYQIFILILLSLGAFTALSKINANTDGTNIIITEVLYDAPNSDTTEEWIELYNPTSSDISIDGWSINDNYDSFALSGTIPAGGYLVLAKDATAFYNLYGFYPDVDTLSGTTDSNGIAEISYRLNPRAPLGTYTITIEDIVLTGYTYDASANTISSKSFTVS